MSSSANPVGMREKYFPIFSQRLDLGIQPLCAWIAWILASWRAISLFKTKPHKKKNLSIKKVKSTDKDSWWNFSQSPESSGRPNCAPCC